MRRPFAVLDALVFALSLLSAAPAVARFPARRDASDTTVIRGFSPAASRTERGWEATFSGIPVPDSIREYMRHLSAHPHHVGSPADHANAEWLLARFKSYGLDAHIEQFDVLFPTP
ncbi:MAG: hypothetical protein ACREK8_04575 [Gemmatimonadales bacterium]